LTGLGLGLAVAAGLMSPLGPAIAGGALVSLLASAGAGAVVGTVAGGLVGLGIPEDEAGWYAGEVDAGRVVVTVREADEAGTATDTLRRAGGVVR
ncbi:MAG: general stress protein, partial [Gemmataceae bacterium]|nr:general stress protein [Gemmataceae bacterium]